MLAALATLSGSVEIVSGRARDAGDAAAHGDPAAEHRPELSSTTRACGRPRRGASARRRGRARRAAGADQVRAAGLSSRPRASARRATTSSERRRLRRLGERRRRAAQLHARDAVASATASASRRPTGANSAAASVSPRARRSGCAPAGQRVHRAMLRAGDQQALAVGRPREVADRAALVAPEHEAGVRRPGRSRVPSARAHASVRGRVRLPGGGGGAARPGSVASLMPLPQITCMRVPAR